MRKTHPKFTFKVFQPKKRTITRISNVSSIEDYISSLKNEGWRFDSKIHSKKLNGENCFKS